MDSVQKATAAQFTYWRELTLRKCVIFEVTSEGTLKRNGVLGFLQKKGNLKKLVQFEPEIPTGTRTNHSGKIVMNRNKDWMR